VEYNKQSMKLIGFALFLVFNLGLFGTAQAGYKSDSKGGAACECWKDRWLTDDVHSGCECKILDADGDGVTDDKDQCPGTPKGVKVDANGCELDSDGDGVVDRKDHCPGTPKGAKVDKHGCQHELDSDGDGVLDSKDKCPGTYRGAAVDRNGCELDSDGDGVVDRKDRCPGTPAGIAVDYKGCAEPIVLKGVNFENDSAVLKPKAKSILNDVTKSLRKRPDVKVTIAGHTDSRGSAAYNKMLSQRRAETVRKYLISHGVKASALKAKGFGEEQPIATNDTSAGRAENRRVELRMQ